MSGKIPASGLVSLFDRMLREHWAYGTAAREGLVDCSGAFVWAYQQYGKSIYHGSNRIARRYVVRLLPVGSVTPLPGMAAFKSKRPGEKGYALPSSYGVGGSQYNGDLQDYYHMGLIGNDVTRVLNAKGKAYGFVSSALTENWDYVARLTDVDYDSADEKVELVRVTTSGGTLNLRKTSAPNSTIIARMPNGTELPLLEVTTETMWKVRYENKTGYAASSFLTKV